MPKSSRNTVLLCRGSRCDRSKSKRKRLERKLSELGGVETVGCQKICLGPVVGLWVDGTVEWFGPIATKKERDAVKTLLRKGKVPKSLKKRWAPKRSGQVR